MHQLIFYPDYRRANPYQTLLYQHVDPAFAVRSGTIEEARPLLGLKGRREGEVIFHLHWEDSVLRSIKNADEARKAAQRFTADLDRFVEADGRLIWTKHNLRPHDFMHADLAEEISAVVAANAEAIIVHSPAAIHAVGEHYRIDRKRFSLQVHGNYRGHYPVIARRAARERLGLDADRRCLLLFGRITSYKGGDLLIQAMNDLNDPALHLLVVGKQPFEPLGVPEGLRERVTVIDHFVEDGEVADVFAAADAVALPYQEILTSGTLFLAMGAARPVIVPRLPTLLDVANDDVAFSYRPGDVASLTEAIRAFARASDQALSTMGERAAVHAVSHDWHLAGRQLSDIIHGLLARRPKGVFGRLPAVDQKQTTEPGYLARLTHPILDAAD
ncbi:MAG: glycosyltransferase [Alphaproteobacteria bacterium]|nr:glycosyltransferase [Alphaproteobacteria bacterium]